VTWGANFKNKTISSHVYQRRTSRYFDLHSQLDGVPYPQTILKSTFQRSLSGQNGFWRKWQHLWRFSVLVRQSKKPKSRQAICVFTDAPLWNGTWTGMLLVNRTGTRLLFLSVNGGVPRGWTWFSHRGHTEQDAWKNRRRSLRVCSLGTSCRLPSVYRIIGFYYPSSPRDSYLVALSSSCKFSTRPPITLLGVLGVVQRTVHMVRLSHFFFFKIWLATTDFAQFIIRSHRVHNETLVNFSKFYLFLPDKPKMLVIFGIILYRDSEIWPST